MSRVGAYLLGDQAPNRPVDEEVLRGRILRLLGAKKSATVTDLAKASEAPEDAVSQAVDALASLGFVLRSRDRVELTASGEKARFIAPA